MADLGGKSFSRRRFLVSAAAAVAGPNALGHVARGLASAGADLRLPAPKRSGINHVVVVMMENRSFDHLLGWLPHADGKQAGLTYRDRGGQTYATYPLAPDFQGCGHPDPDHSHTGGLVQYNNGACDGFLRSGRNDRYAIGYYTARDLRFLGRAARYWTVCDRYFPAIMAETFPNRLYMHTGVTNTLSGETTVSYLPTIWDRLRDRGLSGRSYHSSGEPFLQNWGSKYVDIIRPYAEFLADCRRGRLPHVAFVDPPRAGSGVGISADYHPFGDVRAGEAFVAQTYNAVVRSPAWASTVLVIVFDEWGGFFDHVPPPRAPDVKPEYELRGFRVPCLVVSPLARRRYVAHGVFDHTSILRMIEWRWSLPPLSTRDAQANNLASVLDFSRRRLAAPRIQVPSVTSKRCPGS
jgi:phospholipase C